MLSTLLKKTGIIFGQTASKFGLSTLLSLFVLSGCIRFSPVVEDAGTTSSVATPAPTPTVTTAGSLRGATFERGTQFTMVSYVSIDFTDSDGDQSGKVNWVKVSDNSGNDFISSSTSNLLKEGKIKINTGTPRDKLVVRYNTGTEIVTVLLDVVGGSASVDF